MRYRIRLVQHVLEEAIIEVDATTRQDVETIAIGKANAGDIEWHFLEAPEPVKVVYIRPITHEA